MGQHSLLSLTTAARQSGINVPAVGRWLATCLLRLVRRFPRRMMSTHTRATTPCPYRHGNPLRGEKLKRRKFEIVEDLPVVRSEMSVPAVTLLQDFKTEIGRTRGTPCRASLLKRTDRLRGSKMQAKQKETSPRRRGLREEGQGGR